VSTHDGQLPILPGATLGVLGGGQLGRMFVHAAQRMGYFTAVLDPDADSPAGRVSHHHIHTDYDDVDGLARLAGLADAVTTEFENVPAPSLEHLAVARRCRPKPRPSPLRRTALPRRPTSRAAACPARPTRSSKRPRSSPPSTTACCPAS
jgi:5-(carboxyamino)imidazole ribonucleotide synthase